MDGDTGMDGDGDNVGVDFVQVTEHHSWFDRLGDSFKGVLVGPILVLVAVGLLFWNEGQHVHRLKDLEESMALVQSPPDTDYLYDEFDGQLVHVTGVASSDQYLYDDVFGIAQNALKLTRNVQTYQWVETESSETKKDNYGGGSTTKTTYSYHKEWKSGLINSNYFHDSSDHQNPQYAMFEEASYTADPILLGAYELSDYVTDRMDWYTALGSLSVEDIPEDSAAYGAVLWGNSFYFGDDPGSPEVGDTRVTFTVLPSGKISVLAVQSGDTFEPYYTKRGGVVILVERGSVSAQAMVQHAKDQSTQLTWFLRFVGLVLMFMGFSISMKPLTTFFDIVPLLGGIANAGTTCIAFIAAVLVSSSIIALAWLFYRPLIGGLILLGVGSVVAVIVWRRQQNKVQQGPQGFPTPDNAGYGNHQYYSTNQQHAQQPPFSTSVSNNAYAGGEPQVYVPAQYHQTPQQPVLVAGQAVEPYTNSSHVVVPGYTA